MIPSNGKKRKSTRSPTFSRTIPPKTSRRKRKVPRAAGKHRQKGCLKATPPARQPRPAKKWKRRQTPFWLRAKRGARPPTKRTMRCTRRSSPLPPSRTPATTTCCRRSRRTITVPRQGRKRSSGITVKRHKPPTRTPRHRRAARTAATATRTARRSPRRKKPITSPRERTPPRPTTASSLTAF